MAKSTRQHVFEGMELLPEALIPFVEKRLESSLQGHWQVQVVERVRGLRPNGNGQVNWDQQGLLQVMMAFWKEAFAMVLGHPERSYVSELLEVRNKLSHNEAFTYDDAERALDTMRRLLESVSAKETAEKISASRDTILRTKYAELARNEERKKTQRSDISVDTVPGYCRGARSSSRTRTWRPASSSRPSSRPTSPRCTTAARPPNTAIRASSSPAPI